MNESLEILTKKKKKIEITSTSNERRDIATDPVDSVRMMRESYEQHFANEFDKLGEIGRFLERYKLIKSTLE